MADIDMTLMWWMWPVIALIGACFGSFISLISYRIPRDLPWAAVRSQCPTCKNSLGFRDLVPVFSWALSRGMCRYCKTAVSARYVLMELATAGCFVAVVWLKGPTPEAAILCALAVCVLTLIVTDLEAYMIPDAVQIGIFVLGMVYVLATQRPLDAHLYTVAISGGVGLALHYGYFWLMGKHGLGFGDVKLLAASGIWLSMEQLPGYFLLGGLLGIATALLWKMLGRGERFPFGPALALSLCVLVIAAPTSFDFRYYILSVARM